MFLYGTLIRLVAHGGVRLSLAVAASFIIVTAIELTQRHIVARTAEITDPLLVAILWNGLLILEKQRAARPK